MNLHPLLTILLALTLTCLPFGCPEPEDDDDTADDDDDTGDDDTADDDVGDDDVGDDDVGDDDVGDDDVGDDDVGDDDVGDDDVGDDDTAMACDEIVTFETGLSPTSEIHVDPKGSNSKGDGSAKNPYATIVHAAGQATPGTAIVVHQGTYGGGNTIYDLHGTDTAPIWIGGAPNQNTPVFDGGSEGIHLIRPNYVVVHDLEIRNAADNGLNCDDGGEFANPLAAHHVVFRDLYIHDIGGTDNQDCLKLSGLNDYWVLDSELHDCGGNLSGSGVDHVGCHHGLIARNFIHDNSGNAVQCKGGSEDIEIRWNHLQDCGERAVNMGGSTGLTLFRPPLSKKTANVEARDIRVVANHIEGTWASLAFVGCVECAAVANTIVDPENWIFRILQETTSKGGYTFEECRDNEVIDNLIYFDESALSTFINIGPNVQEKTFVFSHNLWYAHDNPANSTPSLPVAETAGIYGQDPGFTTGIQIDAASPANAAGVAYAGVTGDYAGQCYDDPPSIGAYEATPP